jgi:putative transposase
MSAISRTQRPLPPFRIVRGAKAVFDGRLVTVLAISDSEHIQVRAEGTNARIWATAAELSAPKEDAIDAATLCPATLLHPSVADPIQEAKALSWHKALASLSADGRASVASRQAVASAMNTSLRTVGRRYRRHLSNPQPSAQLDTPPGPRLGSKRLNPAVEAIIERAYEDVYLTRERAPLTAVERRIRELCRGAGLKCPSPGAIHARARCHDRLLVAKRRMGAQEGSAVQAPSIHGLRTRTALEVVQIDHAEVDLSVVTPNSRQPLGRPWITLAIDVHTRCIVGYYLSFEAPNQTSVALCLEHACLPKRNWLQHLGVAAEYPMYGKMRSIHWDNAKTFQAKAIQVQCQRYGIDCKPRPVRQPHYGAYIERYIGTFMGKMHLLPGTTFSNAKQRGSYDSEKRAIFSLPELARWVATEIAGVYHHTRHRGLGCSPAEAWQAAWTQSDGSIALPWMIADPREFVLGMLPCVERAVTREGISLHGLRYWDAALTPFINDKIRHTVHYHQGRLSTVYLRHGAEYLDIPLLERGMPEFSLHELKDLKRSEALKHDKLQSEANVFAALKQQREIQDAAAATSKKARRQRARRPESQPRAADLPPADYTTAPPAYKAKWQDVP